MKSAVSQFNLGSAEEVIAHAAWQRTRGRRPAMSFVGQRNPRKALAFAGTVIRVAKRTALIDSIGSILLQRECYDEMTDVQIEVAARHIISSSSSEAEVRQRIRDELGYPDEITLETSLPNAATGREARELVRGLGGLVMKNGAMAMAIMHGHDGTIQLC